MHYTSQEDKHSLWLLANTWLHTVVYTSQDHLSERERNVLFNDALNTFYLRLFGIRHMVKDHSDSERGNPLPPTWATLSD